MAPSWTSPSTLRSRRRAFRRGRSPALGHADSLFLAIIAPAIIYATLAFLTVPVWAEPILSASAAMAGLTVSFGESFKLVARMMAGVLWACTSSFDAQAFNALAHVPTAFVESLAYSHAAALCVAFVMATTSFSLARHPRRHRPCPRLFIQLVHGIGLLPIWLDAASSCNMRQGGWWVVLAIIVAVLPDFHLFYAGFLCTTSHTNGYR